MHVNEVLYFIGNLMKIILNQLNQELLITSRSWKSCKSDILIGWSVTRWTLMYHLTLEIRIRNKPSHALFERKAEIP